MRERNTRSAAADSPIDAYCMSVDERQRIEVRVGIWISACNIKEKQVRQRNEARVVTASGREHVLIHACRCVEIARIHCQALCCPEQQ